MMIIAPLLTYLVTETLTISGLLSLITCSFILSLYAKQNLNNERKQLVSNSYTALSFFCKNVSDLFIGMGFGLFFSDLLKIRVIYIIISVILTLVIDFSVTYSATLFYLE